MGRARNKKKNPWRESTSELYRPSNCLFSAKLVPTFADRGCHVVSVTDLYGRILVFLDRRARNKNMTKMHIKSTKKHVIV
jgi:hypothetical protein